jgi:hypothetical protein
VHQGHRFASLRSRSGTNREDACAVCNSETPTSRIVIVAAAPDIEKGGDVDFRDLRAYAGLWQSSSRLTASASGSKVHKQTGMLEGIDANKEARLRDNNCELG